MANFALKNEFRKFLVSYSLKAIEAVSLHRHHSREWCRCKETASIAFKEYETKNFLNSFFSAKFANNRKKQIIDFDKFISTWDKDQNLVFVTHYVVISEILNYAPSSGEIVVSDKSLKVIDTLEIEY